MDCISPLEETLMWRNRKRSWHDDCRSWGGKKPCKFSLKIACFSTAFLGFLSVLTFTCLRTYSSFLSILFLGKIWYNINDKLKVGSLQSALLLTDMIVHTGLFLSEWRNALSAFFESVCSLHSRVEWSQIGDIDGLTVGSAGDEMNEAGRKWGPKWWRMLSERRCLLYRLECFEDSVKT